MADDRRLLVAAPVRAGGGDHPTVGEKVVTATYVTNAGAWYALGAGCFLAIATVLAVLWARHQDGAR